MSSPITVKYQRALLCMEYEVKLGDNVNAFRRMYKILFPSQLCIKRLDKLSYTCMV